MRGRLLPIREGSAGHRPPPSARTEAAVSVCVPRCPVLASRPPNGFTLFGPRCAYNHRVQNGELLRGEIRRRLEAVRTSVALYFDSAHPSLAAVREIIEAALDDVRTVLNVESGSDGFWLSFAAQQLASAEAQFLNAQSLIDQHGGRERDQLRKPV
jgi:hypothetical protein